MQNFYYNSNMTYPEKVVAMENFTYGSYVKCSIPVLTPLMDTDYPKEKSEKLYKNKLCNLDKDIGIDRYNSCNYIKMFIPRDLCPNEDGIGYKGEKFICIFVAGNINQSYIISRGDE